MLEFWIFGVDPLQWPSLALFIGMTSSKLSFDNRYGYVFVPSDGLLLKAVLWRG